MQSENTFFFNCFFWQKQTGSKVCCRTVWFHYIKNETVEIKEMLITITKEPFLHKC